MSHIGPLIGVLERFSILKEVTVQYTKATITIRPNGSTFSRCPMKNGPSRVPLFATLIIKQETTCQIKDSNHETVCTMLKVLTARDKTKQSDLTKNMNTQDIFKSDQHIVHELRGQALK